MYLCMYMGVLAYVFVYVCVCVCVIYTLAINVTAACDRDCTASVGLLVKKRNGKKRKAGGSKEDNRQKMYPVEFGYTFNKATSL